MKEESNIAMHFLGPIGKLISNSKSGYRSANPGNLVIFNSNVCAGPDKVWWGDLDVTISHENLSSLAIALNKEVSVLYEMDGRFENEDTPRVERYVVRFNPDGTVEKSKSAEEYNL